MINIWWVESHLNLLKLIQLLKFLWRNTRRSHQLVENLIQIIQNDFISNFGKVSSNVTVVPHDIYDGPCSQISIRLNKGTLTIDSLLFDMRKRWSIVDNVVLIKVCRLVLVRRS